MVVASGICLTGLFSSCKKDKEEDPMMGLWNVRYIGNDDNGNGVLDEAEKDIIPDTSRFTFLFSEGGSGQTVLTPSINTGISTTVPFTWTKTGSTVTITTSNDVNTVTLITLDQHVFYGVYGEGTDKTWLYASR